MQLQVTADNEGAFILEAEAVEREHVQRISVKNLILHNFFQPH